MIKHYIFMSSSYTDGTRVALDITDESLLNSEAIGAMLKEIKRICGAVFRQLRRGLRRRGSRGGRRHPHQYHQSEYVILAPAGGSLPLRGKAFFAFPYISFDSHPFLC